MVEKKSSFLNAANYVRKKRPIIFPNIGFQKQLLQLEQMLRENSKREESSAKPKKAIRSANPASKSEIRQMRESKHGRASHSVYKGKHGRSPGEPLGVKYKLRQSVKIKETEDLVKEKAFRSYKDKAKYYYTRTAGG